MANSFESTKQIEAPTQKDEIVQNRIESGLDVDYILNNVPFLLGQLGEQECRDVIKALACLVIKLEDQIPSYDTILSDDASGRIVSLFLREVINRKKTELEEKPVQTFFIASGRHHNPKIDKAIDEFIAQKKSSIDKALLVTEYIHSGNSLLPMTKTLEKQGINFDIAAVSINDEFLENESEKLEPLKRRLNYGGTENEGMVFYNKQHHTGVTKENIGVSAHPIKSDTSSRQSIRDVRKDIKFIAAEISKLISHQKTH